MALTDSLPTNPKDRIKLVAAVTVIVLCLGWLTYTLWPSGPGRTKELVTPAWTTARAMDAKLHERKEFLDVGFVPVSESPMRFRIQGAVHAKNELPELEAYLKEIRPENDYEVKVEVLNP